MTALSTLRGASVLRWLAVHFLPPGQASQITSFKGGFQQAGQRAQDTEQAMQFLQSAELNCKWLTRTVNFSVVYIAMYDWEQISFGIRWPVS